MNPGKNTLIDSLIRREILTIFVNLTLEYFKNVINFFFLMFRFNVTAIFESAFRGIKLSWFYSSLIKMS